MAAIELNYVQELTEPVKVRYLDGNVFSLDSFGYIIGVDLLKNGTPATVSGTVSGSIIRPDGSTVVMSGGITGNRVYVGLPQAAVAYPGVISIVIKLTSGGGTTTVFALVANVYQTSTDTTVDPGTIIPSIQALIGEIEYAVSTIPADYSSLWASLAPNFSTSVSYKLGQYCTYDGAVYRFTSNHNGNWNSSHATAISLGTDISAMRGVNWNDADMSAGGYSTFIDIPSGQYSVSISTAGSYGFPAGLGKSFHLEVTTKANSSASNYAFKGFFAYSNGEMAYFAMAGGSSSPSNLPAWAEILCKTNPIISGQAIGDTELTAYGNFYSIPMGCYFIDLSTAGTYGFPERAGQYFYLEVSGAKSNNSLKTYCLYSVTGACEFAITTTSTSASNLPKWNVIDNSITFLSAAKMTSLGFTNFVDIPQGQYAVLLSEAGTFGFPISIGLSFVLDVSGKQSSNYSFVRWEAYGNNGTAIYAVGGGSTSAANPPAWYYLTSNNGGGSAGSVNKFSDPLGTVNLLLLGDSITQGAGASELGNGTAFTTSLGTKMIWGTGNSWALKLVDYLGEQYPNITVTNHGWGGITIAQLAQYIDEFVPANTTHCIIGLGVNSEGSTSFDGDISTIINYLLERNIKVFAWTSWLGTHPNKQNINTAGRVQAALMHAYRNVGIEPLPIYSIAKRYIDENNIPYMDVMQYQPDDEIVHPNDLGHTILFRLIREGFGF